MKIKIKLLSESAVVPKRATSGSAAYDVYAPADILVHHGRNVIMLGFAIELPVGFEAKIEPRSGYSSKGFAGFATADSDAENRYDCDVIVGKIDSDYRGDVGVIVYNRDNYPFVIKRGQRIAQLTIYRVEDAEFTECEELGETRRGGGGFGHTNI